MKKKILSLFLTLVLALSASSITAFADQKPDWYNGVLEKVDACATELESTDGTAYTSDMALMGGSLDNMCASLNDIEYGVTNSGYTMYSIKGNSGALTYMIDITVDEDGDIFGVRIGYYIGADLVSNAIYNRKHTPTLVPMKAPTTTEDGYMSYYACSCGMCFKDSAATQKIADINTWKTTAGMGLIHKFGSMDETTTTKAPEKTTKKETTTKEATKKETKKDTSKKSPKTGASAMGLGFVGTGVAILTLLKKKEN